MTRDGEAVLRTAGPYRSDPERLIPESSRRIRDRVSAFVADTVERYLIRIGGI